MLTLEEIKTKKEDQTYDRKSARIEPKSLANTIVAFANADGGTIAVGIEDDFRINGIDDYTENINEIMRVPFDFCNPSVKADFRKIDCIDQKGKNNHLLLIEIPQSSQMHATHQDEVYYRMGDKSKKLNFEDRLSLMYAKGETFYEDEPVAYSTIDDIDLDAVRDYCQKIGYKKSSEEYIKENNGFLVRKSGREEMSGAAILLFGKNPQQFFPRARVRFTRYEGNDVKTGKDMNVIKDEIFEGRILDLLKSVIDFTRTQLKERTFLGEDGIFKTIPEYPEFVWTELIVNAIAHRDYGIKGTDIQIKLFDDHFYIENPGMLAGFVRLSNIRNTHFSRNPKIAAYLKEYGFVKEFGEGVDRIYRELEENNLPEPRISARDSMVSVEVYNQNAVFDDENAVFGDQNAVFDDKNAVFESIKKRIESEVKDSGLYKPNAERLIEVLEKYSTVQVFSRSLIMDDFHISSDKAGDIINLFKKIDVVEQVKGFGKGKYRFKD